MKIRIIANKPIDTGCSDITEIIGQTFEAVYEKDNSKNMIIVSDEFSEGAMWEDVLIFEGEYEIID